MFAVPLHPLLVHFPVVMVPLLTIAWVLVAFKPSWRAAYGAVIGALTTVTLVATFLAAETGEQLEEDVRKGISDSARKVLHDHTEAGDAFRVVMLAMFVTVIGSLAWEWYRKRNHSAAEETRDTIGLALRVLALVVCLAATAAAINAGHSGAESTWNDEKSSTLVGQSGSETSSSPIVVGSP